MQYGVALGLDGSMSPPVLKAELRAQEYRARAEAAAAMAAGCALPQQRELHENAAATWTRMAEGEERRIAEAHKSIAAANAAALAKASHLASLSAAS